MNVDTEFKMDDLTLINHLKNIDSPFLPKIKEVYEQIKDILNSRIQYVFPQYTLHNIGHSFRIMEYMSKLVGDITKLNQLEIAMMVYSALLHDIGMAVSEEDVSAIKADSFPFCDVKFSAMKELMGGDEVLALQEYVRRIHAFLSGRYIRENLSDKLVIPKLNTIDFTKELALICEAHTQDYDWIKSKLRTYEIKGDYSFNPQFIAAILRLADILDIDGNRTPYNLYKLVSPKGISDEEWRQHFVISNNEKIVINEKTQQKKIVFHGRATNASIHRKILVYIGWVKDELVNANALVSNMPAQYSLVYDTNPEVNIQTEGYTFSDYRMTLDFRAVSSLLMGEKIYGSKSLGLRELIQNALDSCRIRQETEEKEKEFGQDAYQPKIKVILDREKNVAIVKDNGTGMSMDIIKKHFLNIGVSYYNSKDFLLKAFDYKPIGNFGIGFLSCFMLSNEVKVLTRYYKSNHKYLIALEKGDEWTSLTEADDVSFDGTEVILNYTDFLEVFDNDPQEVEAFLKNYFLTDGIEFELIDRSAKEINKIQHSIIISTPLEKGLVKVDFQDYLKNIEGYALIRRKSGFIRKFEDLNFKGTLYQYDDDKGFLEVTDFSTLNIDDYINGNEIKYLSIPLVERQSVENFASGMKFTNNDIDDVIQAMEDELTWIAVVFPKDLQSSLSDQVIGPNDGIFGKLNFQNLVAIGHSSSCATSTSVHTRDVFEGRKNELYMPFETTDWYRPYWQFHFKTKRKLFIRSVLIKDFRFSMPLSSSIFHLDTIVANISSRNFIPDISRNDVDSKDADLINYIISKAIHIGASKSLTLDADERATLEDFIKTSYAEKTDYEK